MKPLADELNDEMQFLKMGKAEQPNCVGRLLRDSPGAAVGFEATAAASMEK